MVTGGVKSCESLYLSKMFDEQNEQDVVLLLAGIHTAAKLIAGGPEEGVEIRFFNDYVCSLERRLISFCIFYRGSTIECNTVQDYPKGSMIEGGKNGPTLLYKGFLPPDAECPACPILSGSGLVWRS